LIDDLFAIEWVVIDPSRLAAIRVTNHESEINNHQRINSQKSTISPMTRVFNFSAGPAVMPLPVLEQAQRELVALPGVGMSVMEISHRSRTFEDMLQSTIAGIRDLAGVPSNYRILFLQGGASLQFTMVPMNLLRAGTVADYIDTGTWAVKAVTEARRAGSVNVTGSTKADNYDRIPSQEDLRLTPGGAYVHITTNNTIEGTEWKTLPEVGDVPLVADASSDIFSGPIDAGRFGLIYAGAQKNLGPAGLTLVIIRDDLLARSDDNLPTMLSYKVQAANNSLYNTPNTFGVYILGLVVSWLKSLGGLPAVARLNERKAARLYAEIDRTGFYRGTARKESRSLMNITFRLPSEDLEKAFDKEATAAGLDGLKGHRSVGGMRASIYNAFPEEGVDALVQFMREFERRRG
jgi:phosphoserine aminotransferase